MYKMDVYSMFTWLTFILFHILEFHTLQCREEMWDGIAVRFSVYWKLPIKKQEALDAGYTRQNDICKTKHYHGFLYRYKGDTKLIPIYDLDGWLSGIQAIIPGNMKGYNSKNETISVPPVYIMPPVLPRATPQGVPYFTITAYFKHPQLVCNPIAKKNVQTGKGLYIQTGDDPVKYHEEIPMEAKYLKPIWKQAACLPSMGTHYFYNLTKSLECERIYPVFLMYDNEGNLGAFGWTFQGEPLDSTDGSVVDWFKLTKNTLFFTFDVNQLPACMLTDDFKIFGIHIWLQPHDRKTMKVCPERITTTKNSLPNPDISTIRYSDTGNRYQVTQRPETSNIIDADPSNSANDIHLSVFVLFLLCFISRTLSLSSIRNIHV